MLINEIVYFVFRTSIIIPKMTFSLNIQQYCLFTVYGAYITKPVVNFEI